MSHDTENNDLTNDEHDDSDADAFAVLGLLVIVAVAIVYYTSH